MITSIWFLFWCIFVFDTPDTHPRISKEERQHINEEIGKYVSSNKSVTIPWKSIVTSIPFLGLMVADSAATWGMFTLLTNTPTYMKNVQGVDIKTNGLLSALPFLCRYIGGITICQIADFILKRKIMSTTNVRRLFSSIGFVIPGITLLMIAILPQALECNTAYVITLLCVGMFFNGAISGGHYSNHVDLAPNFAGTLFGITNTFSGGVVGFLVPLTIGALLESKSMDIFTTWKVIFGLAAGIYFFGNLCFVLMASGDVQPWNFGKSDTLGNKSSEFRCELKDNEISGESLLS